MGTGFRSVAPLPSDAENATARLPAHQPRQLFGVNVTAILQSRAASTPIRSGFYTVKRGGHLLENHLLLAGYR